MVLVVLVGIVLCITLCYWWVKAVGAFFDWIERRMGKTDVRNPYIKAHLSRMKNDQEYQDYLEWLDRSGGDLPFDKWKTKEEMDFESKINPEPRRFKL